MDNIVLSIKHCTEKKRLYEFTNNLGYKVEIEICEANSDPTDKKSLPYLWFKRGCTDRIINNYLVCTVYVTDLDGHCWGAYNPTHNKGQINFEWLLEATEENENKIINKVYELANKDVFKINMVDHKAFDKLTNNDVNKLFKKAEQKFKSLFINHFYKFEKEACFNCCTDLHGFYFPNLTNGLKCIAFINGEPQIIYN